jgi:hypothetical protein
MKIWLVDYIFVDIYGWHPSKSEFWVFDNKTLQRANRLAFQPQIKSFAKTIVRMIRRIKKEILKSQLLVEFGNEYRDALNSSFIKQRNIEFLQYFIDECKRTGAKSRRIRARH